MVARKKQNDRVTLRRVAEDDREFLLEVYGAGREIELAAVPWPAEMKRAFVEHQYTAQDVYYQSQFPGSTQQVILLDEEPAGRIYLHRTPEEIAILDMAILPMFRKRRIATTLIKRLQQEAKQDRRSIRVYIETFNPADALFTRLGFQKRSEDGISSRYDWFPSVKNPVS
jgi:GNAT superfamily N-acetyltransferase